MKYLFFVLFICFNFISSIVFGNEINGYLKNNDSSFSYSRIRATHETTLEKSIGFTINCVQTITGNLTTVTWSTFLNPLGDFVEYQVYSVQNGLLATISSLGTTTYSETTNGLVNEYYIIAISGLGGTTQTYSDTLSNIHLTVSNPSDGTAILVWNNPSPIALPFMDQYYKIYREYPTGTWILLDSVPYGVHNYKDTIDICSAFINYRIILPNQPCNFASNFDGDDFEDLLNPNIPIIQAITIDTLTGDLTITWNENYQPDTYGYIIYSIDANGFPAEIDTVWGLSNTSYTYNPNVNIGALTYSIAAFDSCFTASVIPTYQTSAKAETQTTVYLRATVGICDNKVSMNWTPYLGWNNTITYEVWGHIVGQPWENFGTTNGLSYSIIGSPLQNYCFAIKAKSTTGQEAFSNKVCLNIIAPSQPTYNYLQVATINSNTIELKHLIDLVGGVQFIVFQKLNKLGVFEEIARMPGNISINSFIDEAVFVDKYSYTYRVMVIDSCGNDGALSNTATTILLKVKTVDEERINYLNWTAYSDFNGPILGYNVYRGIDGYFSPQPLAFLTNAQFNYEDILLSTDSIARTCYYVEAVEGINLFGLNEISRSNAVCKILKPIIYIPNSFTPNGDAYNQTFLPVITYYDYNSYHLMILDRWEHPIFESKDATQGWTGEINSTGKSATPGTYLYILTIKNGEGEEIVKRGNVNILK